MNENLVVASKIKNFIKNSAGMNTSASVMEALTRIIEKECNKAIENAKRASQDRYGPRFLLVFLLTLECFYPLQGFFLMYLPSWPRFSFSFLLIALLSLFTIEPFLDQWDKGRVFVALFLYAIFLSTVYALYSRTRIFVIALVWVGSIIGSDVFAYMGYFSSVYSLMLKGSFLLFFLCILLHHLFQQKNIDTDAILGAVTGYFLLGFLWSFVYQILEQLEPGTFSPLFSPNGHSLRESDFLYYSYVTLTTLGFGDMTAMTTAGRSFSVLEAMLGQIYLTVLIAQFVNLRMGQQQHKEV